MAIDAQAGSDLPDMVDALGDKIDRAVNEQIIWYCCLTATQTVLYAVLIARLGERIAS